ncbi:MAG: HAMP domain-containing protein, partial [Leptospiraceae bacterium]|nr:HAMP domain-containing protein [Leptospiraceae bacterium]
ETLFKKNKNLIFFGVYSSDGKNLTPRNLIYNNEILDELELNESIINKSLLDNSKVFSQSVFGLAKIQNVSSAFHYPVMGISLPFISAGKGILICYLKLDKFLETFQSTGAVQIFLVNSDGRLLAHPDIRLIEQNARFSDLPIFKSMKESKVNAGMTRYKDKSGEWFMGSFKKIPNADVGIIATIAEKKAFEEVYNIRRRNIFLMIVVLNLAILIVYYFAKSISQPILKLVSAAKQIEFGQFALNLKPTTTDEVGILTNSFLSMSNGLMERENLKASFGKFVNKEIAELASRGELDLGGQKRICTVFFSDIRGFTSISEKLNPQEVVEFLNEYLREMVSCVKQMHGNVDKFIGDAIMAVWGGIKSTPNDAENAINCALLMRETLLKFNKGRGSVKKPIVKFGIGINTGPVIAGQIGSDEKLEFTVVGDTVNLASRMEALNKTFGTDILVSESTLELVNKDLYKTEKIQSIKVRGKSQPVTIYALLGKSSDPHTPDSTVKLRKMFGIDPPQSPAYGRRSND